ncbi:MAG: immune inhibitor A, partial [Euryarchaeota archaeon]|nr:immune inhibitor A [Euryarchaeota archaeon]
MKQKMKTIALMAIIVMTAFVAICAFSSAAVEEDTSDKISGYLKYTMKQGYPEMEPVEKPDITAVGKPVKPLKTAMAEDKVAKGVKGVRERETLPSVIGGVITTEAPLTEDQVKQLENLGVEIRSRMGTVTTVNMPKDKIQDIASLDYIRYIEGARPVRMHLDAAVPEMGADQAWTNGYPGEDVIIGIADTGIDVNHGDFYFDAAKNDSKILCLWDQKDSTGPAPAPYSYGTEWTKAQIDAGSCTETDTDGHGTHVAGITASTGLETGNYPGVAPDANIIFVKTTFWDIDIIDGWKYIVERAQAEGKPCVISCSIGTYFSPHDGSDPMAQAADWCAAQGVLVICSAGNDGDWPVHATIQQPRTEIWSDDFDSGFGNWVTDGGDPTWHRVTDRSTSPDYSTYPGMCMDICKYVNNQDSTMTMASSINLSGTTSPNMTFQLWSEIESMWDYLDVDVSSDGGATWTNVAGYDGDMGWTGLSIDLSSYKSDQVNVRFRFVSDEIFTYDGPYIDDVAISDGATILWSDDFESGFGNWVTDGGDPTWHQEDFRSCSGSYSAYPGRCGVCEYVNNQYSTMTMASSIDLSGTTYPVLAFELWSDIESGWDYLYVDVSSDGGTNWRGVWSYGNHDRNWRGMLVDLTPYKSDQVKVRFRFVSDDSYTCEGPYIDDVVIYDQSSVCGGTYAEDDTYNLEVALDPWYRESLVDLYYDLDDHVSIEVRT